jgi:hypothetical protein
MTEQVTIVSPSYKRAGDVKIRKWLPNVVLAVHEFEADSYKEKEGGQIMVLPDTARGNMAKVRQAILDQIPMGEWVVMMDDDVEQFGYFGSATGLDTFIVYDADEFYQFIDKGTIMAEEVGTTMWGVNVSTDPRFYREYTPLSFSSPVLGPFCVQKRIKGVQYDARLGLKEDYDMFLQHLRLSHRVLRINSHWYRAAHLTLEGGCASYRVIEEEKKQMEIFQRKWGKNIVKSNLPKSTNPKINSPIAGV